MNKEPLPKDLQQFWNRHGYFPAYPFPQKKFTLIGLALDVIASVYESIRRRKRWHEAE